MLVFVMSFLTFILLSVSNGITIQETVLALLFGAIAALIVASIDSRSPGRRGGSGFGLSGFARIFGILHYVFGPFAVGLYKANVDVAKRIIHGNINPGIVKFNPGLRTDGGKVFLADSITLTPGTLTVDIDDDGNFYIHWINVESLEPSEEQLCGSFAKWSRRLFG